MPAPSPSTALPKAGAVVRPLPFAGDERRLLEGLRAKRSDAVVWFYRRYHDHVLRVLVRVLGADGELADLHHDVFVRALASVHTVEDAAALGGWITIVTVNVARSAIKRRTLRRWLRLMPADELPDVPAPAASEEDAEAARRTYAVLDKLPADERVAFALRHIDGMELTEVAAACEVSLATIKRRLAKADDRFRALAQRDPVLVDWIEGGTRWKIP